MGGCPPQSSENCLHVPVMSRVLESQGSSAWSWRKVLLVDVIFETVRNSYKKPGKCRVVWATVTEFIDFRVMNNAMS